MAEKETTIYKPENQVTAIMKRMSKNHAAMVGLVMSMCRVLLVLLEEYICYDQCIFLAKL